MPGIVWGVMGFVHGVKKICFFSLTAFALSDAHAQYDVILVAGQSNAVGVDKSAPKNADPLETSGIDSLIFQLGRCGGNDMKIIPAKDPLENWACAGGYGSAMPFARRYIQNGFLARGRRVLILPAAKSGLPIKYWNPHGGLECVKAAGRNCFEDMVHRLSFVLRNPNNRLVTFIWQHGEADMRAAHLDFLETGSRSGVLRAAVDYRSSLSDLIDALRRTVPESSRKAAFMIGEPACDVVDGKVLSPYYQLPVATAMRSLASDSRCIRFVPSNGLSSRSSPPMVSLRDHVHFTSDGQFALGVRYAAAFAALKGCR